MTHLYFSWLVFMWLFFGHGEALAERGNMKFMPPAYARTLPALPPGGIAAKIQLPETRMGMKAVTPKCLVDASQRFQVPLALILAILDVEKGSVGQESVNRNKTVDLGPMQINTCHLRELAAFGITREDLLNNGCLNVYVGAWLLRGHIDKSGSYIEAVGRYHSLNASRKRFYQKKAIESYLKLKNNPQKSIKRILKKANALLPIASK